MAQARPVRLHPIARLGIIVVSIVLVLACSLCAIEVSLLGRDLGLPPTRCRATATSPTVVCEQPTATCKPATAACPIHEPTKTRTCAPTATLPCPSPTPSGAVIKLHVIMAGCYRAGTPLPTIVQWQDGPGAWHDVHGWQGPLDPSSERLWWVAEEECGKGPFRWVIFDECGCSILAISKPFHLPQHPDEILVIEVRLDR